MSFEKLRYFMRGFKELFTSAFLGNIGEVTDHQSIASDRMMQNIDLWLEMYSGNAPWLRENQQSLGLPTIIATEIARAVTLEMKVSVSGSGMADYITEQFEPVLKDVRHHTEYACAGGGVVFKPYVCDGKIITEVIQANAFYPIAYNSDLKITAAYFLYRHWDGREIYSRLERHELEGTNYTITNKAYKSMIEETLGTECPLSAVTDWANIEPEVSLTNVDAPLFSYFRVPIGNTIDHHSPLGVSVYSRAVGLIREADKQFQRLMWEYEGGELAIDASEDAFRRVNGKPYLPENKERLFRMNNLDAATTGGTELLKAWTPSLRDANYTNGLNRILMQVEDACCLARGTISDPAVQARTATELKLMKQRSYATISDTQMALQDALDNLAYAMYCIACLYDLCPDGTYEMAYVWDDSIIVDAEAERIRDQQEVSDGLMLPYEYRMKWYGEDEKTAKAKLAENAPKSDDEILFGSSNGEGGDLEELPVIE